MNSIRWQVSCFLVFVLIQSSWSQSPIPSANGDRLYGYTTASSKTQRDWEKKFPGRIDSIFAAIKNVGPSQLADASLFDFANLKIERPAFPPIRAVEI